MNFTAHSYWQRFERHYVRGLAIFTACIALAVGIGFLLPTRYASDSRTLVVQKQLYGIDAYTAYRSAERSARNLAQISSSSSFRERALTRMPDAYRAAWRGLSENKRRDRWENDVRVSVLPDATIFAVTAYGSSPEEAQLMNAAVDATLMEQAPSYLDDNATKLSSIDAPAPRRRPTQPDFLLLGLLGTVVGLLSSAAYFWSGSNKN